MIISYFQLFFFFFLHRNSNLNNKISTEQERVIHQRIRYKNQMKYRAELQVTDTFLILIILNQCTVGLKSITSESEPSYPVGLNSL